MLWGRSRNVTTLTFWIHSKWQANLLGLNCQFKVEWLGILSGGALRFAPFLTCKLARLEPSFCGWCLCLPTQHSKKLRGASVAGSDRLKRWNSTDR